MVKEITQPQLAGYSDPNYFFVTTDGAVACKCPASGATTPNSQNPRTELRQMKNGGQQDMGFSNANKQWQLDCVLRFSHMPTDCDVVGMQIHDGVDDVTVLRRVGGTLVVTKGDPQSAWKEIGSVNDSTILNMRLVAEKGGGFTWYRDGTPVRRIGGTKSGLYFKAGCYVQRGNNPSGYGQVDIFALTATRTA